MALRAFGRRWMNGTSFSAKSAIPDPRLKRAAVFVAEALENRRLLSMSPAQIAYQWNHLKPALRHDLAVYEYIDPEFQVRLNAELATYGLQPIQPEAGALNGFSEQVRSRFNIHSHKLARPRLPHKPRRLGRLTAEGPAVTETDFNYNSALPNTLVFRFDQSAASSDDWINDLTVIDLDIGAVVPTVVNGSFDTSLNAIEYKLNVNSLMPNGAILASGKYVAILDGSKITAAGDPTLKMIGSDRVMGDSYAYNFFFGAADIDHSGTVSLTDFGILSQFFGSQPATFSQGDLNYDGKVSLSDFGIFASDFGATTLPLGAPGALTATSPTDSQIDLSWGASADATVTGYDVYRDNSLLTHVSGTTYADTLDSSSSNQPHTYFVVAKDDDNDSSDAGSILVAQTAPTVVSPSLSYQTLPQQLTFTFNQNMSSANWSSAFTLINLKTGSPVTPSLATYSASPPTVIYSFNTPLPDGNYAAILKGGAVTNSTGVALEGSDGVAGHDYVYNDYFLDGDLTHTDRAVTTADVTTATANEGHSGTYSQGDVNYDGTVDATDVSIISTANSSGVTLPQITPTPTAPTLASATTNSISLSWAAVSTTPATTSFDIYRDYTRIASNQTGTTYTDTGVAAGSSHIYFIVDKSADGQTSYNSPELRASATQPAPSTPSTPIIVQATADSVLLAWTDDDPSVTGYDIYRNGSAIATNVATSAYYDTGLTASTGYTYYVQARTAVNGISSASPSSSITTAASSSLPAGYLTAPPAAPTGVSVSAGTNAIAVSWTAVTGTGIRYEIDRAGVAVGGSTTTTFTDHDVVAGTSYSYQVIAYDAAYNKSAPSAVSASATIADTTPPGSPIDLHVTAVTTSTVSLAWSAAGDDVGVTHYNITRTPAFGGTGVDTVSGTAFPDSSLTAGTSYTYSILAIDAAGNQSPTAAQVTAITTGGTPQTPVDSAPNQYIPQAWQDDFYNNLTKVLRQRIAAVPSGSPSVPAAQFWYDPSDTIISGTLPTTGDLTQIPGTQGLYAYQDISGTGAWTSADPVWLIAAGAGSAYQSGETVVYPTGGSVTPGTSGRTNINSATLSTGTLIWKDNTTFSQDFANFYTGLTNVLPYYASAGSDYYNPSSERLSVGAALGSGSNVTFTGDPLTITEASGGVYTITDTTNSVKSELIPGDCVDLGGVWYPVQPDADGTTLDIAAPFRYMGNTGSGITFTVRNWTLVPTMTDSSTGAAFSYERGTPSAGSLIFPQQFAELHSVLSQLNTLAPFYGIARFDSTTSARYRDVAAEVINAYDSLVVNHPDTTLANAIINKASDPGAVYNESLIADLRSLVYSIAGDIYVRGTGSNSRNGWAVDNSGDVITFADPSILDALLPEKLNPDDPSATVKIRIMGNWSGNSFGSNLGNGSNMDPEQLAEIERFVEVMTGQDTGDHPRGASDQALFVKMPMVSYSSSDNGAEILLGSEANDILNTVHPDAWPPDTLKSIALVDAPGPNAVLGHLTYITQSTFAYYENPMYLVAIGDDVTATLSSSTDAEGSTVTSLIAGPAGYNTAGWSWGEPVTLLNVTAGDVEDLLVGSLPDPPAVEPGDDFTIYNLGASEGLEPSTTPGLDFEWSFIAGETTDGSVINNHPNVDVSANVNLFVFGRVPLNNSFSYTPDLSHPPFSGALPGSTGWLSVAAGPNPASSPLPLTTQMDYQNVEPDTNLDGIVNVPVDMTSFGYDTGVMAFQAERLAAQTYLPIFTNADGALPYHAYIQQGAFADAAADGSLLATDAAAPSGLGLLTGAGATAGLPYFYSLDTYIRPNVVISDSVNHVKRMEVIRPGGNAVVFDFPWQASTNSFSPLGSPLGWDARDACRTYVLRDLDPGNPANMKYALEFADGTVQTFDTKLVSVSEPNGLTQSIVSHLTPTGDTADSDRYSIAFEFSGGNISGVDYQVDGASGTPPVIHTAVGYGSSGNPDLITSLSKTYEAGSNPTMPEFDYSLSGSTITAGLATAGLGTTISRSGTAASVANTSVTITVTPPASDASFSSGTSTAQTYQFNADSLITSDTATLNGSGGLSTSLTRATYTYYTGTRSTTNGSAPWGEAKLVTTMGVGGAGGAGGTGGETWVDYVYNSNGWVTDQITPFESNAFSPFSIGSNLERQFSYDPNADASALVQRPAGELDYNQGVFTGGTMSRYFGTTVITRQVPDEDDAADWDAGLFQTTTTATAYNAGSTTGVGASSQTTSTFNSTSKQTSLSITQLWGGNPIALSSDTIDAFGYALNTEDQEIGSPDEQDAASVDVLGRSTADTLSGGAHAGATYDNTATWFGPVSVTESDGSLTRYTYNAMGETASKIIYSGTLHAVKYSWVYDAAGNAVSVTTAAVNSSDVVQSSPPAVTNTYQYDALGRIVKEVDNAGGSDVTANKTTSYVYSDPIDANNVQTITNPDGSTEAVTHYFDGTLDSDLGTAVTSSYGNEGVIATDGIDAAGAADGKVTAGSTWTSITTNGAVNTTTTYTNTLGEVYLVQETTPGSGAHAVQPVADAATSFDGNGRPIKYVDFDGTTTYTSYDPVTGQIAMQFVDVNGNGVYDPGVDQKSVTTTVGSTLPAAGSAAGSEEDDLSNTGDDDTVETEQLTDSGSNAGEDDVQTENGLTTDTKTPPASGGGWTSTTTNPDGTKIVDTYTDGLLTEEQTETSSGSNIVTPTTYTYDGLRRLITKADYTGVTTYTYFQDGTQATVQTPGHNPVAVAAVDPTNDAATQTTRADSGTVHTPQNSQTRISAQFGAGVLPATYGYDSTGTGQLTSLTTYQGSATFSGTTITGTGAATTTWAYDPATGLLASKTYADGSSDQYQYNSKFQLASEVEPGITSSSFTYNAAGQLTSSSLTDATTGKVSMQVTGYDEMGRPISTADTDNGKTFTTTTTTNANQQPNEVIFGSAGDTELNYNYYPTTGYGTTGSPSALQTMTLTAGDGTTALATTSYTYDSSSKRLSTITVNGVTFTFDYFSDSNQIQNIIAVPSSGGSGITTTYIRDTSDKARLSQVSYSGDQGLVFKDAVAGYNQEDQITSRTITRTDANDDGSLASAVATASTYTYDPNHGDALTNVSITVNGTAATGYSYAFDDVGNFTSNSALGTANNVNQYSGLTYNSRGDVTDDGTYSYGYDANDRLIRVTPHDTSQLQLEYGYDSQGRRLWKDVYAYSSGAWSLSYSRHYIWDGNNLVAELDGNNQLLVGYTWGPMGLLAETDYTATGGPKTYVVAEDFENDVTELIDPTNGKPVASYHYDPYGAPVSSSGPEKNLDGPEGQEDLSDKEDRGLGASPHPKGTGDDRIINYATSSFMQRDAAGELAAGGPNPYQVDGGDPINKDDPSGQDAQKIVYDFNNANLGFNTLQFAKDGILDMPGGKQYRITDVKDDRRYYVQVRNPATIPAGLPYSTISITRSEAASPLYSGSVWVEGTMTVWYDDTPITGSSKYFDSVMFQQLNDAQRLAQTIQLGHDVGQFVDGALHLVPGAPIFLDLPEAISGRQMSTGQDLGDGGRAMAASSVLFTGVGVVLDALKAQRLAKQSAVSDMIAEDLAELNAHDRAFYNAAHNNSLLSLAPAQGYILRDINTGEPLAYGMTTRGTARYTQEELRAMNANMFFVQEGSVAEMRAWETKQITDYLASRGERPPLNRNNH